MRIERIAPPFSRRSGLSASPNETALLVIGAALRLLTLSRFLIGRHSRYAA